MLALGFSGDGQYLASADSEGLALVWKRGVTDRPWIGLPGNTPLRHGRAIRDINFHPTETTLLATASDDRSAKVWTLDLEGRRLMPDQTDQADQKGRYTLRHDRAVTGARWSPPVPTARRGSGRWAMRPAPPPWCRWCRWCR